MSQQVDTRILAHVIEASGLKCIHDGDAYLVLPPDEHTARLWSHETPGRCRRCGRRLAGAPVVLPLRDGDVPVCRLCSATIALALDEADRWPSVGLVDDSELRALLDAEGQTP
jgi:hypothetical protein